MPLAPVAVVTPEQLAAGQRALIRDSAWASVTGALSGGVILVAFALALGATPLHIGLLAAIPFIAQASQLPATLLIERIRQRRRIGVIAVTVSRTLIMSLALLPFLPSLHGALMVLIGVQIAIALFNAAGACAINSWLHQLVPRDGLGNFFSKRLFWGTALSCVGTLAAGNFVDHPPLANALHAYAAAFALAGVAGYISSFYLARVPEPIMQGTTSNAGLLRRLSAPFQDRGFRRHLIFIGSWVVASNLAGPFLTVYLIQQLGLPIGTVTGLWVTSQVANALTVYAWGRLSDRLSNKAILSVALPTYFLCTFGLVFIDLLPSASIKLGLLFAVHIAMGIASGGIGLANGNLGLKLAPQGQGTSYLAAIGLVSAITGGIAPIVAGTLAQAFQASELSAVIRFVSSTREGEFTVLQFAHWEFLFALSALAGFYVMHALSRIEEGGEFSERIVIQQFAFEAARTLDNLSSIGGTLGNLFPFERFSDRLSGLWRATSTAPSRRDAP